MRVSPTRTQTGTNWLRSLFQTGSKKKGVDETEKLKRGILASCVAGSRTSNKIISTLPFSALLSAAFL